MLVYLSVQNASVLTFICHVTTFSRPGRQSYAELFKILFAQHRYKYREQACSGNWKKET